MTKTPEQMAEEYGATPHEKDAFLAGYEAAMGQKIDGNTSDGYHTFNELYEHRVLLFLAALKTKAFKAQVVCEDHYPGWDVITCYTSNNYEQISYHVPIKYRDFYRHLDRCSKEQQENNFDGHDSKLVAQRIEKSLSQTNLPTSAKWISVKERLPNCGVLCAWISDTTQSCIERIEVDDMHPWHEEFDYWCELPEPPMEEA